MKKAYSLYVRGKRKEWCFTIHEDSQYVEEWRSDGLKIDELLNTIPQWWVDFGLPIRLWCWLQDTFFPM